MLHRMTKTSCLLVGVVVIVPLVVAVARAQQPVRPLPKLGACPSGYHTSSGYCVPNSGGRSRGAIEKIGSHCPVGFSTSGRYCLSDPSNRRQAIEKTGTSCPSGWFTSGRYCVQNR